MNPLELQRCATSNSVLDLQLEASQNWSESLLILSPQGTDCTLKKGQQTK